MERGKKTEDVEVRALTNYIEHLIVVHAKGTYERGGNKQSKAQVKEANVDGPNLVTCFNRTPMFEWYAVWCGSNNGHQNDTCLKEVGLRVSNNITILNSTFNIVEEEDSCMTI